MCREMKDSGIEWIGEINNEWSIVKIAKLAQFINGYAFNGEDLTIENEIPVIRIGDIQEGEVNLERCLKYKKDEKLYLYSIQSKDVLIAMSGATTGKTAFINEVDSVAYINQRVGIIRNSKYSKYINYSLNTGEFKKYIDLLADGSAQPNISTKGIMNYYLALPNKGLDNIINYLDKKVSQVDDIISKQKILIEKYKSYKQSLITETVTKGLNKNVPMKDSGIEWIGEIPSHWKVIKVKNTCYLKGRIGWQGLKTNEFIDDGPYLITGTDFRNGGIDWNTCVHITEDRYDEAIQIQIKEGDLLITKDGTIGKLAIVKNMPYKTSLNSGVLLIRCIKDLYINKFLYYVLSSGVFWKWYKINQTGNSTILHLYQEKFKEFQYALPDLEEQQQIIYFLDKKCSVIDFAIAKKEQLIEKLEAYKKSLIYECVTGKREVN